MVANCKFEWLCCSFVILTCRKRDEIVGCADEVFTKLERSTSKQEEETINTVRKFINVGIDFVCHNDGDRIACK